MRANVRFLTGVLASIQLALLAAVSWPGPALAQAGSAAAVSASANGAGTAQASTLPDAALSLLVGNAVVVEASSGVHLEGRFLGFDAATITLVLAEGGDVVAVQRATVTRMRLAPPHKELAVQGPPPAGEIHPPQRAADPREGPPATHRHVGIHFAAAPSLMLDVDYGRLYGFADFNLVFPLATAGQSRVWLAGSAGGGASFRISPNSAWKFDVFAHVAAANLGTSDRYIGFGLGLGMHCTFPSGFTFSFKIPAIGYSVDAVNGGLDSGEAVAFFYLSSAMGLPLLSVGYRF